MTPYFTVQFSSVNLKHRLKTRVCIYFVFPSQTDNTGGNKAVSRVSCSESIENAEDSLPEVAQEAELSSPTTEVSNSITAEIMKVKNDHRS